MTKDEEKYNLNKIDIELMKQHIIQLEKDMKELQEKTKTNYKLLITSLVAIIIGLIGLISVFL